MSFNAGAVVAELRLNNRQFITGINSSISASGGLMTKLGSLAGVAARATAALGAVAAVGAGAVIKNMISTEAQLEQNRISFTTMLGDAEKAQSFMGDLSDFAKKTPFEILGIQDSAKKLMAYGIESDKVIDTLNTLGNISAGVGLDKMPQLTLAFGQVRSATYLTGAELRQFTEAGVPLLEELAKQSGKTASQVKAEMESGMRVPFEEVEKALKSLTGEGGRFSNLMIEQSKSLSGVWSNLKDSWTLAMSDIAQKSGIFDLVKDAAMRLMNFIETHKETIIEFASNGVGFLVEKLSSLWGLWERNREKVIEFVGGVSTALTGLDAVKTELGRVFESGDIDQLSHLFLARAGVPTWITNSVEKLGELRMIIEERGGIFNILKEKWEEFKQSSLGQYVLDALGTFKEIWPIVKDELIPVVQDAMPTIKQFFEIMKDNAIKLFGADLAILVTGLRGIAELIKLGVRLLAWYIPKWEYVADAVMNFKENASRVFHLLVEIVKTRLEIMRLKVQEKIDEIRGKFDELWEKVKQSDAFQWLMGVIDKVSEKWNTFKATMVVVRDIFILVGAIIKELADRAITWLSEKIDLLKQKWEEIKKHIADVVNPIIDAVKQKFYEWRDAIQELINKVIEHFQPAAETIKTKTDEVKTKTEETKTKFEELKQKIIDMVDRAKEKLIEFKDRVVEKFNEVKDQIQPVIDRVEALWQAFSDKFGKIARKVSDVITPIVNLRNTLSDVLGMMQGTSGKTALARAGGSDLTKQKGAPSFANGVRNFIGGEAMVGENGPEKVILPTGSSVIPNAQTEMQSGRSAMIHIENMNVNERSEASQIAQELDLMLRLRSSTA